MSRRVYVFSVDKSWLGHYMLMVKVINPLTDSVESFGPANASHLPAFFSQLATRPLPDGKTPR